MKSQSSGDLEVCHSALWIDVHSGGIGSLVKEDHRGRQQEKNACSASEDKRAVRAAKENAGRQDPFRSQGAPATCSRST